MATMFVYLTFVLIQDNPVNLGETLPDYLVSPGMTVNQVIHIYSLFGVYSQASFHIGKLQLDDLPKCGGITIHTFSNGTSIWFDNNGKMLNNAESRDHRKRLLEELYWFLGGRSGLRR